MFALKLQLDVFTLLLSLGECVGDVTVCLAALSSCFSFLLKRLYWKQFWNNSWTFSNYFPFDRLWNNVYGINCSTSWSVCIYRCLLRKLVIFSLSFDSLRWVSARGSHYFCTTLETKTPQCLAVSIELDISETKHQQSSHSCCANEKILDSTYVPEIRRQSLAFNLQCTSAGEFQTYDERGGKVKKGM